ncbi:MAG: hypothetical protein C4291_10410 [Candidatus Dadabacteria bacterium]
MNLVNSGHLLNHETNLNINIPGTEIKGALRTAILRKLILDGSSGSFISSKIKDIKNKLSRNIDKKEVRKELKKLEEEISARAFRLPQKMMLNLTL